MRYDEKQNQVNINEFHQDSGNTQNIDKNDEQNKTGIRTVNLMEPLLNITDSPKPCNTFFIKKTESVSEPPRPFKISFEYAFNQEIVKK